jgi:RNA polymerase sigma-B factor
MTGALNSRADDRELLRRYRSSGDERAREELLERYLPLARRLAARYRHTQEPTEDLIQVASAGLVAAIERFDPERGTAFSSFAVPTILGELKRYFRDHGWFVHVPRDLQERVAEVNKASERLGRTLGRSPSVQEVAEELGIDAEQVLEGMEAAHAYGAISLDAGQQSDDDDSVQLADLIGEQEPGYEVVEYGASIRDTLEAMPRRTRVVLHLRFVEDMTQAQIAERVGVSQMHVSRIIRAALAELREAAAVDDEVEEG